MSYLVDALKKAERERHEQRGADLRTLSSSGTPSHGGGAGSVLRWFVIVLVACNAALLAYLVWPDNGGASGGPADTQVVATAPSSQAPASASASTDEPDTAVSDDGDSVRGPDVAERDRQPRSAERDTQSRRAASGSPEPSNTARGRVTYSDTPLDEGEPLPPPGNLEDAPSIDALGGQVPDVVINGHLFSSVPGRSFILVNGRRYHEGERLAAGPAVESVDARGATLNYRGQRYHVNGPG